MGCQASGGRRRDAWRDGVPHCPMFWLDQRGARGRKPSRATDRHRASGAFSKNGESRHRSASAGAAFPVEQSGDRAPPRRVRRWSRRPRRWPHRGDARGGGRPRPAPVGFAGLSHPIRKKREVRPRCFKFAPTFQPPFQRNRRQLWHKGSDVPGCDFQSRSGQATRGNGCKFSATCR
jgi:hypothetical protein